MKAGGIYIHIPFCRNKCIYCDFYSAGSRIANWDNYILSLLKEVELRVPEVNFIPLTLYFGGGTPSLLPDKSLMSLIKGLASFVNLDFVSEFTLEVNPEDVNEEKCRIWKELGINRISIGIQSLNDAELKIIGRTHSSYQSFRALETLKKYFDNISVDLIFGIPGQNLITYTQSIDSILSFQPQHISCYSLMLEPNTALTLLVNQKRLTLPSEDLWLSMYDLTLRKLDENNFIRYEISNFSLEGFQSHHNSNYWTGGPYLGFGPSAHSYNGENIRKSNPSDLKSYISYFSQKGELWKNSSYACIEELSTKELQEEEIMMRLRTVKGLNLEEFASHFSEREKDRLISKTEKYKKEGLMKEEKGYLKFTNRGFMLSDSILVSLI